MNQCSKCKKSYEDTCFYRHKASKNGIWLRCKECISKDRTIRYARLQKAAKLYTKIWKKENKAKVNANNTKRRAAQYNATPKWLTKEHLNEIEQFYVEAQELQWLSNEPLHVDHIIPLQGENVCGLHVPWNLQILPASHNIRKSNR